MSPIARLLFGTVLAALSVTSKSHAQSPPVAVSIASVSSNASTVTPGQTVIFSAALQANQTASGYPVEFSVVAPGSSAATNTVDFAAYQANQNVNETTSWTVPQNAPPGTYTLYVKAYDQSWDVPALAAATTTFTVAASSPVAAPPAPAPLSITLNSFAASPAVAQPGQVVTLTAMLTASQNAADYPIVFSISPPGSTRPLKAYWTAIYKAGKVNTASIKYTVPANTQPGVFNVAVSAYDPAYDAPSLASGSSSFAVTNANVTTAQQPGPSASLFATPFYSCLRSFYVAQTGNDSNPGTSASPWLTIQQADSSSRLPGDCVMVAPGTYQAHVLIQHGGNAPSPTGYVVYRCEALDACHVLAPSGGHLWGFTWKGSFTVVDGFEVDGNNALQTNGIADACFGSDAPTYGTGNSAHHIWILNDVIHDCNLAGVSFNDKEWYYVEQNTVYHNSWESGYQGSGISFVVVQCIEAHNAACASGSTYSGNTGTYAPSGMDLTYMAPFHNVVSGNIVYDNMIAANNPVGCGNHTDGNGIIMDTFLDQATLSIVYPYQTMLSQNISFSNGGRGIHVFRTSNVTVANNTALGNGTDNCISAYYLSDLSQAGGSNNVWVNNIAQSVESPVNTSCSYCGNRNTPFSAGDSAGIVDQNNTYADNVTYGGYGVQLFNNDTTYFSCSNNKCNTNPMILNPGAGNFALSPSSPALNYGIITTSVAAQPAFTGACSSASQSCP